MKKIYPALFKVFFVISILSCVATSSFAQSGVVQVVKTVDGAAPTGSQAFTFQLRSGASATSNGTVLETQVANVSNGGALTFTTALTPGNIYQLFEIVQPGWTSSISNGQIFTSFSPPDGVAGDPNIDNSFVGFDFTVTSGQTKIFNINNTFNCAHVWQDGDMLTYNQSNYGDGPSVAGQLLAINFIDIYPQHLFVGTPLYLEFVTGGNVFAYLPDTDPVGVLTSSATNPTSSSAGDLGGQVLALQINVDYSAAGLLPSVVPLGDLVLTNTLISEVNGMTVSEFLALANAVLGGGNTTVNKDDVDYIASQINNAFINGTPSQFAINSLLNPNCNPCPTSWAWLNGDAYTRSQLAWDSPYDWYADYGLIYAATYGAMEVGIHGTAGYSLRYTSPADISGFFVQTGTAAPLAGDHEDPTSTESRGFGGEMIALRLNIDFADYGASPYNTSYKIGDLILHDLENAYLINAPELNGLSVREIMEIGNIWLGGGTSLASLDIITDLITQLNAAFLEGVPSPFALNHLTIPCENIPTNHCAVATSSSVTIPQDASKNIELQATDEDNDALTYSISQNPSHGTVSVSATNIATYIPTAGYSGTDQFKFKASDGKCDDEATVDITIVICPVSQGYWKNKSSIWPISSLTLGSQTYTKTELLNILKMPVGSGPKADASLILADQLIAAKLSIANGTAAGSIATTIAHADALFSTFTGKLPYKVKPNTTPGKAMTTDASALENFNNGSQTAGCTASQPAARLATTPEVAPVDFILEQNQPNPFYNTSVIRYHLPVEGTNYRVTLKLYDVLGREVKTLVDETQGAGVKTISFNAASLSGGIYYYRLTAGKFVAVRKMILVK